MSGHGIPYRYRKSPQWADGSVAYYAQAYGYATRPYCALYSKSAIIPGKLHVAYCDDLRQGHDYFCEGGTPRTTSEQQPLASKHCQIPTPVVWSSGSSFAFTRCPLGYVTYDFLACDARSACWSPEGKGSTAVCRAPLFSCRNDVERVAYMYVCDFRPDCSDASDETFCVYPPCRNVDLPCSRKKHQCMSPAERCDGVEQCVDGGDERDCIQRVYSIDLASKQPPAIIHFDAAGAIHFQPVYTKRNSHILRTLGTSDNSSELCPETHFLCPGADYYCLPVYVRCNDVNDCPGHEDEKDCDSYSCPGFYRCRESSICLHAVHVCDGVGQCPRQDDETVCNVTCPEACLCYVTVFICTAGFRAAAFPLLRYLEADGSGMTPKDVTDNVLLVYLSLARCGLTRLHGLRLPNLRILDVSDNRLTSLADVPFEQLTKLHSLSVAGNALLSLSPFTTDTVPTYSTLLMLDVSRLTIPEVAIHSLDAFPNLHTLNLSQSGTGRVLDDGFQFLKHLRVLDLRGCSVTQFQRDIFKGLDRLEAVFSDNYKLCCPQTLPAFSSIVNCQAPKDEISSCDALLRSDIYRIVLCAFAALALTGNLTSFAYRVLFDKARRSQGFGVLVTHLCLADFMMGVYLAMIGVADRVYQGTYLWNDTVWKDSATCHMAGFLSLVSSEVSAFIICLITLDRFLVLRFPFSSLHLGTVSAHVACTIAWLLGLTIATLPLLPITSHWQFYSHTSICIPLPITRKSFAGHSYSFAVLSVLNFGLFVLIAMGQAFVFWSIRTNMLSGVETTRKSQDLTIARRLVTVVVSDLLCWLPVGVMGLLASNGVAISSEVNVAVAIVLLPINSALNPFMYTINMTLERRWQAHERRLTQMLMTRLSSVHNKSTNNFCVPSVGPCDNRYNS